MIFFWADGYYHPSSSDRLSIRKCRLAMKEDVLAIKATDELPPGTKVETHPISQDVNLK